MVHMQVSEFEDMAIAIAEDFGGCYISARFVEENNILTCGLFSTVTHELLASIVE